MKCAQQKKFSIALLAFFASRNTLASSSPDPSSPASLLPVVTTERILRDVARWLSDPRKVPGEEHLPRADRRSRLRPRSRRGESVGGSLIDAVLGLADDDELVDTFAGLLDETLIGTYFDLDLCTLVESAIGFGVNNNNVEASCFCSGDLEAGLDLRCLFETNDFPSRDDGSCDAFDLELFFGGLERTAMIDAKACARFAGDEFEETCFSYNSSSGNDELSSKATCLATYGGQQCGCSVVEDDGGDAGTCLSIDCSPFLPGARINTFGMPPSPTAIEADSEISRPVISPDFNETSKTITRG